jgi:rSAM/selenodomain-associated transferase 1
MPSSNHNNAHPKASERMIVIMAKAPRLGGVKSRLAQSLAPSHVLELYRCFLDDTVALARSLQDVDVSMMCPAGDVEDLSRAMGEQVHVVAQKGEGLAAALTSVFDHFAAPNRRIIALDSDSPHLPGSALQSAFDTLASSDLVVGPTHDGGYYLVGAKASHPGLFDSNGMGTTNAFETLVNRASALGLSVGFTAPFYDVDVEVDLKRLAAELQIAPQRAPRTAAWLKEWRQAPAEQRSSIGAP